MGSQVGTSALGLLGNVLGSFIGGPIGGMIGGMAGGIIGSLLFSRKAKPLVPDVQLMNSSYGKPIPIVWGKMRLPSNMIWQTDIVTSEHSVGGKGMSGGTAYTYKQSAAHAFCEGPVTYLKLYLDGKLFYDNTALFPQEMTKYVFAIRPYPGDDTQMPDPSMQFWVATHVIPGNSCPAYRGLAYMVFVDPELNHFGNRFPQVTCILSTTANQYTKFVKFSRYTQAYADWSQLTARFQATSVDWERGVVYALYHPRTLGGGTNGFDGLLDPTNWGIIVYSMRTQNETMARDYDGIFFDGGLLPLDWAHTGIQAIAITSGPRGMIYLTCQNAGKNYLLTVDPNTLIFSGDYMDISTPGGRLNFGAVHVKGFALTSVAGGITDMVVGVWEAYGVFVCNPLEGTISDAYPVEHMYLMYSACDYLLGADDTIAGKIDLWIFNAGTGDPVQEVLVYRDQIVGSDPSMNAAWGSIRLIRKFQKTDFGVAADQPWFSGYWLPYMPDWFWSIYYPADDSFLLNIGGQYSLQYSYQSNTVKWTVQGSGMGWRNPYAKTDLGYFPVTGGGYLNIAFTSQTPSDLFIDIDMGTGARTYSPVSPSDTSRVNALPGTDTHSNSIGNFVIYQGYQDREMYIVYLMRPNDNRARVADIIRDICHRVGMTDDMLDLSMVTQTTTGYCIQEMKSAGAAIADLLHVYQIDMVESDYTLKFVPRGQPSVVTIPQGDLASIDHSDPSQFWKVKEAQQQEMPMILVVRFQDPDLDFQSGASYAKRTELPVSTIWSKRRMTIDLPVIANNNEATAIATNWLWTMWSERDTVETVLPWKYLYLDPADNITVIMDDGDFFEVRIEEQNIGADLSMHINAAFEDNTIYNPSPTLKGASYGFIPQTVQQAPFADFIQFNVPLLQDQDDTGGISTRIYFAVGSDGPGWISGTIWRSTDNSATWQNYVSIPFAANWGHAMNTLADTPSKFATDYLNTVTIQLAEGSEFPQTCTYDEMLSGANGALLGSEVIQYQIATFNADGSFTLSNILRGRRGTEWATGTHETFERFVMLQAGKIGGNTLSLAEINVQELWKLVPTGRVIDQTPTQAFTYRGFDLMPYAPVQLKRTTGGGGLVLTWVRRTRMGNVLMDGTDTAPLYESAELYNAYILPGPASILTFNPGNPASYTRSYMGLTSPTCTYTSGQMTTDSFYPATSTLYLVVYQVSSVVGLGFQAYAALPPF